MSRLIYVAHSQALIMSEDLARNGVRDSLDFFARAAEARMTVYVFVAEGKAKAILDVEPEFEKTAQRGDFENFAGPEGHLPRADRDRI